MAKTTTELADEVLYDMAVADRGETPDTTDRNRVISVYNSVYERLSAEPDNLTYWDADDNIPEAVFHTIRNLVRIEVQGSFGMPLSMAERQQLRVMILRDMRRHMRSAASGMPTRNIYY